ncbi:thiamine-phosphate kinase [Leucobacter sp. Z1108]|uniref:thiamine-phosphate kinase n=1 Tax=Leucobacter sp. Z1108 TaxID=3439066 RepID=UPI003F31DF42
MGERQTVDHGQTVGEVGESGALAAILARLRPARSASVGPGDDAAVLTSRGDTVVTTDTMIEGPDFRLAWHSGYELGWKLAATNLSDVAAMGARPTALTVALACPRETPVALLAEIARGIDAACAELAPGCGVVGGDLGRAAVLMASITALGDLEGRGPVLRSGARPGNVVAYAGDLGLSGIGLSALFGLAEASESSEAVRLAERPPTDPVRNQTSDAVPDVSSELALLRERHPAALSAHLAPIPPIHLGIVAANAGATAMLDVSDGLSLDAARLARASGVTLALDANLLAAHFGLQRGEIVSLEAMLTGGEDHGLLATFPAVTTAEIPEGFRVIGEVVATRSEGPLLVGGSPYEPRGWDPYVIGASPSRGWDPSVEAPPLGGGR